MAMEMASWAGTFVTCTPRGRSIASISTVATVQVSANASASSITLYPLSCCAVDRIASCTRISCARRRMYPCQALESNSTSSSTSTDAEVPSSDEEQGADVAEVSTANEEQESVGKAFIQMRQERVVSGVETPSKTEEFWRGVLEETRLIEWPPAQKVLGTTGVVTSIIVGASLVLLTVNALLARLSDAVFKDTPPA